MSPRATRPTTCRSCGAEVVFAKNADTGKTQIFDAVAVPPDEDGRFLIFSRRATHVDAEAREKFEVLFRDHHVTCPDAQRWRGRTRADPPPSLFS